jgi:hypothetical protein
MTGGYIQASTILPFEGPALTPIRPEQVICCRPLPRPGESVVSQSLDEGVGPELAAAVGVHRGGSGRRLRTALLRASTASWASDIEEPTMRRLRASLMAHS